MSDVGKDGLETPDGGLRGLPGCEKVGILSKLSRMYDVWQLKRAAKKWRRLRKAANKEQEGLYEKGMLPELRMFSLCARCRWRQAECTNPDNEAWRLYDNWKNLVGCIHGWRLYDF